MTPWALLLEEAGHCAAAFGVGHPLVRVSVNGDSGCTLVGGAGERLTPADGVAMLDAVAPDVRDRVLRERLIIALAGDAAVAVVEDRAHWDGRRDREAIHAYGMALELAPWRLFPLVLERVRAAWPGVEALATELGWLEQLDGPRIEELLTPHIEPGSWLSEVSCFAD